jgi:hypothetical protein
VTGIVRGSLAATFDSDEGGLARSACLASRPLRPPLGVQVAYEVVDRIAQFVADNFYVALDRGERRIVVVSLLAHRFTTSLIVVTSSFVDAMARCGAGGIARRISVIAALPSAPELPTSSPKMRKCGGPTGYGDRERDPHARPPALRDKLGSREVQLFAHQRV